MLFLRTTRDKALLPAGTADEDASTCVGEIGADAAELLGDAGLMSAQRLVEAPEPVIAPHIIAAAHHAQQQCALGLRRMVAAPDGDAHSELSTLAWRHARSTVLHGRSGASLHGSFVGDSQDERRWITHFETC